VASNIWLFGVAHGLLMGLCGASATFSPLIADTFRAFARRTTQPH
jgi:fluoride ion exporter CrcB/FEX